MYRVKKYLSLTNCITTANTVQMLPFQINLRLGEPIYEQIVRAVKRAVASGHLAPGFRMPSVRVMSGELSCKSEYGAEGDQVLDRRGGAGESSGAGQLCGGEEGFGAVGERPKALLPIIERLLEEAAHHGVSEEELIDLIETQHRKIHEDDH